MKIITPTQLDTQIQVKMDIVVIDVSNEDEFDGIDGAINVPLDNLEKEIDGSLQDIDYSDNIVITDIDGSQSKDAAKILKNAGFTRVSVLEGGMNNWFAQGYE